MFPEIVNFFNNIFESYGEYAFIVILIFGIIHPLLEMPASILNLTLSISVFGIVFGFIYVILANLIGILLLYAIAMRFNERTNDFLFRKKVTKKIFKFINDNSTFKHAIVIGAPLVPTYPIKLAVAFNGYTFKRYMHTICLAYTFLYIGNAMIYFGVLGFVSDIIPVHLSVLLITLFILYLYFGKYIFKKDENLKSLK